MRSLELSAETNARFANGTRAAVKNTLGGELRRRAELLLDHAAVVASGFAPLTYDKLQCLIDEVRAALRQAGFGRSARIAIAVSNGPHAALAIVAVACSAVSIPLNPRRTPIEMDACFAALRPDAMLAIRGADSAARRAAEGRGIPIIEVSESTDGTLGFSVAETEGGNAVALDELDDPDPDAPAFIIQTSGTAAEPKLIPYSHRNMLAVAARCQTWFDLTPQDRCLSVSPVFYAHGLKVTVFTPLLTGGTVTFPTDASKFDYFEWFGVLKPTWYSAGPTLHRLVFDQIEFRADAATGHSLRFVLSSGAPLPWDVLRGLEKTLGVPVVEHYSSSEASLIAANLPKPGCSKLGTCGIPWHGAAIIVASDGSLLPPGEQGEILVTGATVIANYLDAPDLNRTSFVNGWFKTGDVGSLDRDGFLTLHGRRDDLINRGGEKISPVEIDNALMRHPAVAEAAAFAAPHPRLGEDVAAAVVLRPGMTVKSIELRDFLQESLAPFKVPRRIIICDQLPKGQTGKVVRRRLFETVGKKTAAEDRTAAPPNASVNGALVIQVTEIWERLLKMAPLSLDDDFFENGGDSLLAIEMLAELERVTEKSIPNAILFEAPTIGQLAQKLSEYGHLNRRPKTLVSMNSNGRQAPLFFFNDGYNGRGYYIIALARLLGADQPVLIVAPHGDGNEPIPPTIEAMAADRLPLILESQPEGPYRLCGGCLAGIVAFEVARLLIAAGKKVELVVMLDPPTVSARISVQLLLSTMKLAKPLSTPVVEALMAWTFLRCVELQKIWNISWTRLWGAIRKRTRNFAAGPRNGVRSTPIVLSESGKSSIEEAPNERSDTERFAINVVAMSNYFPKPLAVRVICFSIDYSAAAWRRISSDLEIIKSPGNHYQPDLADIAKHLKTRLLVTK